MDPISILIFSALMWLVITTLLGQLSGWFSLMRKYPDQEEEPLLQLRWQSGSMGPGVHMRSMLNIAVCQSGLRIGMLKMFGILCRDFFVPWDEIEVRRKDWFFFQAVQLRFGNSALGKLTISDDVADRLARAASGHWPEAGPISQKSNGEVLASEFKRWAFATVFVATFFILAPRIAGAPEAASPPIVVAIGFPAVVFGITGFFRYFARTKL